MKLINYIFSINFLPHRHCFVGDNVSLVLNIIGNFGIFLAYILIPVVLFSLLKNRKEVSKESIKIHKTIIVLFILFILSCGISHLIDIIVIWWPIYRFQTYWLLWTALISLLTGGCLIPFVKKVKIHAYKILNQSIQITEIELPHKKLK